MISRQLLQQASTHMSRRALTRNFSKFLRPPFTLFKDPTEHMHKRITVVPGTFIGPETTACALECVKATGAPVEFDIIQDFRFDDEGCRTRLTANPYLLVGNLGSPGSKYLENPKCYKHLNLQVSMLHLRTLPNINNVRHKNIDMIIIRENLEGEYSGIEHEVYPGVFESIKIVTSEKARRVCEFAFEHATLVGRKKVSCVHKANIMKMVDGLFLEICRQTAAKYPHIQFEEVIVDNACMQMVKNPQQYDVLVMPNLYGSIMGSLGAGLVGGAGVVSSASFGPSHMMFEPGTRSSGHDLVGKNIANPSSMIIAGSNMLRTIGLPFFGDMIRAATRAVYREGKYMTKDVGGQASTTDFTRRVVEEIHKIKDTPIAN